MLRHINGTKPTLPQHFWPRVLKSNGCWLWQGSIHHDGYGVFAYEHKQYRAHRAAYELTFGPIPAGMFVCHNCPGGDNPLCCNPSHLWLGTTTDNIRDAVAKGQMHNLFGEAHWGAKLTAEQVIEIRRLYDSGQFTRVQLATTYNVARATIRSIVLRLHWRHLQ